MNEAIIPIGKKDAWNATTPYDEEEQEYVQYFANPELANYMGNGAAPVPPLGDRFKIQTMSYPAVGDPDGDGDNGFDFTNGADGVYDLVEAGADLSGTAFAVPTRPAGTNSPSALAGEGEPRRVDIFPIFYFGVPNLIPYQLATGKEAGPLSSGKPFINNFLPITSVPGDGLYGGDMLRLNMAVPVTDPRSEEFRTWGYQGLVRAAALGLTAAPYNTSEDLEFIPHMDGFPNGRRLVDDVTSIELQAVGGLVLAAVGLPYDDAMAGDYSDLLSPNLVSALTFVAGPTKNDVPLAQNGFPYLAEPHRGYDYVRDVTAEAPASTMSADGLTSSKAGLVMPRAFLLDDAFPNPSRGRATIQYHLREEAPVRIDVYDVQGRRVQTIVNEKQGVGTHTAEWDASSLASGTYVYRLVVDGDPIASKRATLVR